MSVRAFRSVLIAVSSLWLALQIGSSDAAEPPRGFWPNGAEGALSLTFDDGMPSQLEHAVPMLERLDLKATFYVNPGYSLDWEKNARQWRDLVLKGHELGNHTDRHPCSCQSDFRHGSNYCLEKLDEAAITRAIDDAEKSLQAMTSTAIETRSFAYPCYSTDFGAGPGRTSYVPLIAKRYPAARAGNGPGNDPETIDLWHVSSLPVDGLPVEQVIAYVDSSMRRGRWVVLVFHGLDAEWNTVSVSDFGHILQYASDNRRRIWTAPFVEVAKYVRVRREP